jgi:hypothetical protein
MQTVIQPDQYSNYAVQPTYEPSVWSHMSTALSQSVDRVLSLLVVILPGVLAFFVVLALMTLLGMLFSWILRRLLGAVKFDDRMTRPETSGIASWSPSNSPTQLAGRVAFWVCVLLGLVIGVMAFDTSVQAGTQVLTFSLLPYMTHAVGAILLLFIGNLVARFLARTVLIGAVNNQLQYARFLSMGVKWLVLVLTAAMVLDHLQIGGTVVELAFGILFGGIVLTLALAVGLGSRDLVTRSLERNSEKPERMDRMPQPASSSTSAETLRHF